MNIININLYIMNENNIHLYTKYLKYINLLINIDD